VHEILFDSVYGEQIKAITFAPKKIDSAEEAEEGFSVPAAAPCVGLCQSL
jgi:hypothetical protein